MTVSSDGAVVSQTTNGVGRQSIQSQCSRTDQQKLRMERMSVEHRLLGISFQPQQPFEADTSSTEWSLGYYDEDWMVMVDDQGLGEVFILSKL